MSCQPLSVYIVFMYVCVRVWSTHHAGCMLCGHYWSVSLVSLAVWVSTGFCQSMARNLTVQEAAAAAAVASM